MDKLRAYVARYPERKPGEWALRFGISRPHFYCLMDGSRQPGLCVAQRIERATQGAVPLDAWANLRPYADAFGHRGDAA